MTIDILQPNQQLTVTAATGSAELREPGVKRIVNGQALRRQAEQIFAEKPTGSKEDSPPSPEEILELLHELQVHQIELEMQNEELLQSYEKLEVAHTQQKLLLPMGLSTR